MAAPSELEQSASAARDHPAIAAMVEQIRRVPSVERILLFGSRARGDHDQRSDIDLAVACPTADTADWARIWLIVDDAPTLLAIDLVHQPPATRLGQPAFLGSTDSAVPPSRPAFSHERSVGAAPGAPQATGGSRCEASLRRSSRPVTLEQEEPNARSPEQPSW